MLRKAGRRHLAKWKRLRFPSGNNWCSISRTKRNVLVREHRRQPMKIWLDRILAALRWAGEKLVAFAKVAFAKIQVIFNTVYDPPPRTIRFWFWSAFGLVACVWITFAFVNSWFYKPAVQA